MSLFKIKKSDKAAASLMPSWHPNFRNFERLPDVKVVRTSFFVNCAAIVITTGFSLYFGLQEYNLHTINVQISDWQRQIDDNKKPSEQAVQLYQKFQAEEQKVAEVAGFMKTDFVQSDFVIELGQSLPKYIALNSIDLNENEVSLRGIVRGASSDEAFGRAQAYINQLHADPSLSQKFETITMPNIDPNANANQMDFLIAMEPRSGGKR
jgi:hypothetical protein